MDTSPRFIAVVGAGPAGLYAAQELASNPANRVVLFNRDIKPGGLAEYGIYHDKHTMKEGLRKQFRRILQDPGITYLGNVMVGSKGDLTLADLKKAGFAAILVTVGAQGTKWLGMPGEDLAGVYHAKDLVYHYNELPPYSQRDYLIGKRVAVIGAGNVMMDIAHWLVRDKKVEEVTVVVRRGPADVKFTKKEMEAVFANLDQAQLAAEIARTAPFVQAVGQDPDEAHQFIIAGGAKAEPATSNTRLQFRFLATPTQMIGSETGIVTGLEIESNTLVASGDGATKAKGTGVKTVLPVDTVIFAIGDTVDESLGLPTKWSAFCKAATPRYPVDGISYEADVAEGGIFLAGWSRSASDGLVGIARKDGTNAAKAVSQYLADSTAPESNTVNELIASLPNAISKEQWQYLESLEAAKGIPHFKFSDNQTMIDALAARVA